MLNLLADRREFNSDGGWELRTWAKRLNVRNKGGVNKMVDVLFTRPYLIHRDGRVVWSQINAYMDTPDIVMYGDLVLGPFRSRSGRKRTFLVWDSCKSHLVPTLFSTMVGHGFDLLALPVNMTDILQPVDVVLSGPLKAGQRALRVEMLYTRRKRQRSVRQRTRSYPFTPLPCPPLQPESLCSPQFLPSILLRPNLRLPLCACFKMWA